MVPDQSQHGPASGGRSASRHRSASRRRSPPLSGSTPQQSRGGGGGHGSRQPVPGSEFLGDERYGGGADKYQQRQDTLIALSNGQRGLSNVDGDGHLRGY